jgi:imidazole glycerol-phosphate synthase subunit HisH
MLERQTAGADVAQYEGFAVIAIVDYGAGNLASVVKALQRLGRECTVPNGPDNLRQADKWVIPGVGNFKATAPLANGALGAVLRDGVAAGKPLLGVCLGLQWMFEGSTEATDLSGLGAFKGQCERFSDRVKSPHVGWDSIETRGQSRLLAGVPSGSYVYFTHSYRAPVCTGTVATCTYEAPFTAAAERGNLFGVQFHPEKSGDVGLQILENFCAL